MKFHLYILNKKCIYPQVYVLDLHTFFLNLYIYKMNTHRVPIPYHNVILYRSEAYVYLCGYFIIRDTISSHTRLRGERFLRRKRRPHARIVFCFFFFYSRHYASTAVMNYQCQWAGLGGSYILKIAVYRTRSRDACRLHYIVATTRLHGGSSCCCCCCAVARTPERSKTACVAAVEK